MKKRSLLYLAGKWIDHFYKWKHHTHGPWHSHGRVSHCREKTWTRKRIGWHRITPGLHDDQPNINDWPVSSGILFKDSGRLWLWLWLWTRQQFGKSKIYIQPRQTCTGPSTDSGLVYKSLLHQWKKLKPLFFSIFFLLCSTTIHRQFHFLKGH